MKRVISSVMVVVLMAMVFSSCERNESNEKYLTNKKGWVIAKAISNPPYLNSSGVENADLAKSWFDECELSDILTFKSDNDGKRTVLTSTCDGNVKQKETLGTWKFTSEEKDDLKLEFRIPFFDDGKVDVVNVTNLDKENFEFSYKWKNGAGDDAPQYTFTITYKLGK